MPTGKRLIVWAEPGQETLVREAIDRSGLTLAAVGSEEPSAAAGLSRSLAVEPAGNLRSAIQRTDVDLLWLATARPMDSSQRRLLRETGLPTASCQPIPATCQEVLADPAEARTARFVPLFRQSPGFSTACEALAEFGPPQTAALHLASGPGQGTLLARLFDALDLFRGLLGEALTMDAALAAAQGRVPETLGAMKGHMTLNTRFPGGGCGCALVSDAGGGWCRRLTLLGSGGRLQIEDRGFLWTSPDGRTIDSHRQEQLSPGELVGLQLRRLLGHPPTGEPTEPASAYPTILAMCETALLSCRTGQTESPSKLREMLSRP